MWRDLDSGFGHWLAGFVDGEGCFLIVDKSVRSGRLQCAMRVQLRADDGEILTEIRDRLGVGHIVTRPSRPTQINPGVIWQVQDRSGCLRLVDVFDAYPLRARKACDYSLWRQAVQAWSRVRRGRSAVCASNGPHWAEMERLRRLLNQGRSYERRSALVGNRA